MSLVHALMWSFTCFHLHYAGCSRSPGMSLVQSLIHIYKAKTVTHSLTCSYIHPYVPAAVEVIHGIICDDDVSFFNHLVMPDTVLLQSLGVPGQ